MKYFLERGPSSTPKNAEGLPNLPPQNRDGGWSVVDPFPQKWTAYYFQFSVFPLKTTDKISLVCTSFSLSKQYRRRSCDAFYRKIKRGEEKLVLNRVLILLKIQVVLPKGGNSYRVPLCCCFSLLLFAWKVRESLFYLWRHSFFNGERGGQRPFELDLSNKVWFRVRPLLSQKI